MTGMRSRTRPAGWDRCVVAAGGALAALAGGAHAAPRETLPFTAVVSRGLADSPTNAEFNRAITGNYAVGRVRITGTLEELESITLASDARIRITTPTLRTILVQPFSQGGFVGTLSIPQNFSVPLVPPEAQATGNWNIRFYEEFVDAAPSNPDARWTNITFTLDDEALVNPFNEASVNGGDAGEVLSGATSVNGSLPLGAIQGAIAQGLDVDLYRIRICSPSNFSATLLGGSQFDTQLWLFGSNGRGIAHNDDAAQGTSQSSLSSTLVATLPTGVYYLGVSGYDRDPVDALGQAIWLDEPFTVERAPDGPGAAGPLSAWQGSPGASASGSYVIQLTGVCQVPPGTSTCIADVDDGSGTGRLDGGVNIDDLLYYLTLFQGGALAADIDNGSGQGTRDNAVGIEDLLYYLIRFSNGC